MAFMHPGEAQLVRLAEGEITGPRRATLNAHLAGCQRCRDSVQAIRRTIATVASVEAPQASDAHLERILASRASGARRILPEHTESSLDAASARGGDRRRIAAGIAAAAALALTAGTATVLRDDESPSRPAGIRAVQGEQGFATELGLEMAGDVAADFAAAFSPVPRAIGAQSKPVGVPKTLPPAITGIDGSTLKRGSWSYVEMFRDNKGRSRPISVTHVVLEPVTFRRRPALQLSKTNIVNSAVIDTILLDPVDLRPLRRRLHIGRYTIASEFSSDGSGEVRLVRSHADQDSTRPPKVDSALSYVPTSGFVFVHESQLDLLFRVVPLHRQWRATVGRQGGRLADGTVRPSAMTLAVVGEETIDYPLAPSREAWRVAVVETSSGRLPLQTVYLVSKTNGEILRTIRPAWTFTPRGDPDGKYVTELVTR